MRIEGRGDWVWKLTNAQPAAWVDGCDRGLKNGAGTECVQTSCSLPGTLGGVSYEWAGVAVPVNRG